MEIIRGARQMLVNPRNKLLLIRIIIKFPTPAPRLVRALRLPLLHCILTETLRALSSELTLLFSQTWGRVL